MQFLIRIHFKMNYISSIFLVLFLFGSGLCEAGSSDIDTFIEEVRQRLKSLYVEHVEFDTDDKEFGRFKGAFDKMYITGLDTFNVTQLDVSVMPLGVKNLTAQVAEFNVTGQYILDGWLKFPIGREPIHVFGNGNMRITLKDSTTSMKVLLKTKGGIKMVKEFELMVDIKAMKVKLGNLMGGGVLEDVFNDFFSELGPTVFDHYRHDIINSIRQPIIDEINKMLSKMFL